MKVLITGGNGCLGRTILSFCLKNTKDDIYTLSRSKFDYFQHIQCDLLDNNKLKSILEEIKPELVFHCAGIPNNRPDEDSSFILKNNIEGTNNLLKNLENCPRFVMASTVTVYSIFDRTYPPNWMSYTRPLSIYAVSKMAGENLVRVYDNQKKIDGVCIRIPALVSHFSTHGLLRDLIRKVESDSQTLDLFGICPGSIKPFQFVDEVAKLFYDIGTYQQGYEEVGLTVLAGNTDSISVLEVATLVMRELGRKKEIVWNGKIPVGDNNEIYLNPCYKFKSNSTEAILKVLKEYKLAKNN